MDVYGCGKWVVVLCLVEVMFDGGIIVYVGVGIVVDFDLECEFVEM